MSPRKNPRPLKSRLHSRQILGRHRPNAQLRVDSVWFAAVIAPPVDPREALERNVIGAMHRKSGVTAWPIS